MVKSKDIPEILRLDDLNGKAWAYFVKGMARCSRHTVARAEDLQKAARERGLAIVMARIERGQPFVVASEHETN